MDAKWNGKKIMLKWSEIGRRGGKHAESAEKAALKSFDLSQRAIAVEGEKTVPPVPHYVRFCAHLSPFHLDPKRSNEISQCHTKIITSQIFCRVRVVWNMLNCLF